MVRLSIELCRFHWPWMTPNADFKAISYANLFLNFDRWLKLWLVTYGTWESSQTAPVTVCSQGRRSHRSWGGHDRGAAPACSWTRQNLTKTYINECESENYSISLRRLWWWWCDDIYYYELWCSKLNISKKNYIISETSKWHKQEITNDQHKINNMWKLNNIPKTR